MLAIPCSSVCPGPTTEFRLERGCVHLVPFSIGWFGGWHRGPGKMPPPGWPPRAVATFCVVVRVLTVVPYLILARRQVVVLGKVSTMRPNFEGYD